MGVVLQGLDKGALPEVGPVERRNEDFRISSLHKKKIAEAEFARSTYDQVGVGRSLVCRKLEKVSQSRSSSEPFVRGQWIERLEDFLPASIVES